MTEVTYYGHWICPFAKRIKFTLVNRGIPHDEVTIPPTAARPKGFVVPPEFVQNSPKGEIPMIRFRDRYLVDSIPIMEFLDDTIQYNPMLPADAADRAFVMNRVRWLDAFLMMSAARVYYGTKKGIIAQGSRDLSATFQKMEEWLSVQKWLTGNALSIAESIAIPIYVRLNGLRRLGFEDEGPGPLVQAHMERCRELPGWKAVEWSQEQEDEFVGRFLKYREIKQRERAGLPLDS